MKEERLKGKAGIVTGARRGIGRAVALALAEAGADLLVSDIVTDDGLLAATALEIQKIKRQCLALNVDISKQSDVEKMVFQAEKEFGRIDILANIAGVWIPGEDLIDTPEENWDKVIDTNLKGTWFCCRAAGRAMAKQGSGVIINMSSQVQVAVLIRYLKPALS